ncbi:hypothetical protein D3C81_1063410 [compost metagenome]
MAHVEVARHQHRLHGIGQVQQAQQVRHRAARTADRLGGLFVRELEFADQPHDALRFLKRVQVLTLDVLDQRHRGGGLVGHVLHEHRHLVQARNLRGAEAAFAGDDLVAVRLGHAAHEDRLHQPLRADAGGQLLQRALVHARARLVLARLQLLQAEHGGRALLLRGLDDLGGAAQQCLQSTAEALLLRGTHGRHPSMQIRDAQPSCRTRAIISAPKSRYALAPFDAASNATPGMP